jgi:hypothetical protein
MLRAPLAKDLSTLTLLPSFLLRQYYILLTNFVFMGILPAIIMIIFSVLVVRAVDEVNKRRARYVKGREL